MIIYEILGQFDGHSHKKIDYVNIEWFEREKKLLRKTSENGVDIGLKIEQDLNDGDILFEDDENIIIINILDTQLIKTHVHSMAEMGKLCFEIGNRHLSLNITENYVEIPFDNPTFEYLKKLGFHSEKVTGKMNNYIECHAHKH